MKNQNMQIGCYLDQGSRNNEELSLDVISLAESYGFDDGGELQDAQDNDENGELDPEVLESVENDAIQYLNDHELTPNFCYWGHDGEAGAFGLWPDVESAREQVEFVSRNKIDDTTDPDDSEYPHPDFRGEWMHVNERGNATLYVREDKGTGYFDRELWSCV